MALNAFMKISNAVGESRQQGYTDWIEIQGWEWDIKAETSWTRGGGASVGKPAPGELSFDHYYDRASPAIMAYICMGKSFDTVQLHMCKTVGSKNPEAYFMMELTDAFITEVVCSATEEGNVVQKVKMVFKQVSIDYKPQGLATGPGSVGAIKNPDGSVSPLKPGGLGAKINYKWNISAGTASGGG